MQKKLKKQRHKPYIAACRYQARSSLFNMMWSCGGGDGLEQCAAIPLLRSVVARADTYYHALFALRAA